MKNLSFLLLLIAISCQNSFAQTALDSTIFNYFYQTDTLHVTLETDLKTLVRKKDNENYQPAVLKFKNKAGEMENWNIRVKARGNLRRDVCYLPPLKIKFNREELTDKGFTGSNKLKLVTRCKATSGAEQFVLRELVAYKLYNILTEESFRVQLVYFTLKDNTGKIKTIKSFGFWIEDKNDVAKRLDGTVLKPKIISPRGLSKTSMDRMCVFQYMIGNTDWYVYNSHNLKIFGVPNYRLGLVIPYDFDYAGLVNTTYSAPHEAIPIESVTQRFYIGFCRSDEEWDATLQPFLNKKTEILDYCTNFPYFDKYSKKTVTNYVNKFYEIIESESKTKKNLKEHCDILVKRKHQ